MQQAIINNLHSMEGQIMKKVLIVDDEEDMIWSLQKNLPNNKLQVETLTASSGEEALETLTHTPVDLIVTDIKMPGMSGLDLLSEVNSRYPDLGVIVMTAYSSHECQTEAIRRGGLSYIEKPFDINEMRKVISLALQGKGANTHGENTSQGITNLETLEIEIDESGENANQDPLEEIPRDVQDILSDKGSVEDNVVETLLNFSMEDLLAEDDLWNDDRVSADGRSVEDTIVDHLLGVSEEGNLLQTNQGASAAADNDPAATIQETSAPEEDDPEATIQEASAPADDDPAATIQETSVPEDDEPEETKWVMSTREDYESEETKWVINTREDNEPEETIKETSVPEDYEPEETKWVISTREDDEPEETKWVINTREDDEPEETNWVISTREGYEKEETNWVISTREDYEPEETKWVINTREDNEH
jgi:CheY-like chemotaxis protein